MTKEERELLEIDKRAKKELATEVLFVIPRLTSARFGEEYPKKIEVKIFSITKKQTYKDMEYFNEEGWNEIGYIYSYREKNKAFMIINDFKKKLRKSPAVKKVI